MTGGRECTNRVTTNLPKRVKMALKLIYSLFEKGTLGTEDMGLGGGFCSLVVYSLFNGALEGLRRCVA